MLRNHHIMETEGGNIELQRIQVPASSSSSLPDEKKRSNILTRNSMNFEVHSVASLASGGPQQVIVNFCHSG